MAAIYWSTTGIVASGSPEVQAFAALTAWLQEKRGMQPLSIMVVLVAAGLPACIWSLARRRNKEQDGEKAHASALPMLTEAPCTSAVVSSTRSQLFH
jgi:hypothetical protein